MRVYHFNSTEHALSNIALRRIRISRLNDLNDPFELQAVNSARKQSLRSIVGDTKITVGSSSGLLCFSKHWHNPVLWSHYASRHKGICLGFEVADDFGADVEYASKKLLLKAIKDTGEFEFNEEFTHKFLHTKYEHWRYEARGVYLWI